MNQTFINLFLAFLHFILSDFFFKETKIKVKDAIADHVLSQ